jgi:transcriptional regulator with XRE-family HTH domain
MPGAKAYDPEQRRAAIRQFMEAHKLKVLPWCRSAELAESTLRNFLNGDSASLSDRSYDALARAAHTTVAELKGEQPAKQREQRRSREAEQPGDQAPATYEQAEQIIQLLRELVARLPNN